MLKTEYNAPNRHVYTLKKPAACFGELWREALPLGNGLTGVLIPGAIAEERILFNRHDLWSGANEMELPDVSATFYAMRKAVEAGDYAGANQNHFATALANKGYSATVETPLPFGFLHMQTNVTAPFSGYLRGVDMRIAEAFVKYQMAGRTYCRQSFVSRAGDFTALRMTADAPFTARYRFSLYEEEKTAKVTPRCIEIRAKNSAVSISFHGEVSAKAEGDEVEITGEDYTVIIRCYSNEIPKEIPDFPFTSYQELLKEHTALYTPLYEAVSMRLAKEEDFAPSNGEMLTEAYQGEVSPALMERLWRFGRYLFISATSSKGNPVPLYGLWHGAENLKWSQYVANENVQMTYWHAAAGNLLYALPPLIRYYTKKTETFRECAKKLFGMQGIWVSAYTTPHMAGVCVPVSVITNWIGCAGWLCRHFWEYYLYTQDIHTLKTEILPFMYQAALFYADYVTVENGRMRICPSVSPENTPKNLMFGEKPSDGHPCPAVINATMDFAIMKELFTNLMQGMELTGMYEGEKERFAHLLSTIPPYERNQDGAVKEWMHADLEDHYCHRHLSHLYPVFPGNEITKHNNPTLLEGFRKAVQLRDLGSQTGWSLAHMGSLYARLGESERAVECIDAMAKSVILDSLFTLHNDWRNMGLTVDWGMPPVQLDAVFGLVNALQEMIFCRQQGALSILPALPKRLKTGSVRGLVFPEGKIDIAWDENGVKVTLTALRSFSYALYLFGKTVGEVRLSAGETKEFSF